nr:MAG TPA_asm: hypothetical protein [Caudoviricetes sp.]DAO50078.1 MAG TPA: hypothetical protein [Caudoviricetes sp.]DAQ20138.1 MAG TPA: hypothetical protein [Caudoviricetes sp.]
MTLLDQQPMSLLMIAHPCYLSLRPLLRIPWQL